MPAWQMPRRAAVPNEVGAGRRRRRRGPGDRRRLTSPKMRASPVRLTTTRSTCSTGLGGQRGAAGAVDDADPAGRATASVAPPAPSATARPVAARLHRLGREAPAVGAHRSACRQPGQGQHHVRRRRCRGARDERGGRGDRVGQRHRHRPGSLRGDPTGGRERRPVRTRPRGSRRREPAVDPLRHRERLRRCPRQRRRGSTKHVVAVGEEGHGLVAAYGRTRLDLGPVPRGRRGAEEIGGQVEDPQCEEVPLQRPSAR